MGPVRTGSRRGRARTILRLAGIVHTWAYRIWLGLLAARLALLIALIGLLILDLAVSRAHAQTAGSGAPISTETQNKVYMFGIKCYVANAVSATDRRYNADGSRGPYFKQMGEKSYDTIWKFGPMIGKSHALIEEDIVSYQTMMRDAFLRDDAFFQRVRYECGRIGLM